MPSNLIIIDGKKLIWDGVDYANGEEAAKKRKKYNESLL